MLVVEILFLFALVQELTGEINQHTNIKPSKQTNSHDSYLQLLFINKYYKQNAKHNFTN